MAGEDRDGDGRAVIHELGGKASLRDDISEAIFVYYCSWRCRPKWSDGNVDGVIVRRKKEEEKGEVVDEEE